MNRALIELQFLPSIEYFCALSSCQEIILEKHENFLKQSYRNRCHILTTHAVGRLSIPLTAKHGKVAITAVQIDYSHPWQRNLWRTLLSSYAKSPYFEHYADELHRELFSKEKFLFDLNRRLLSMCLKWLQWDQSVSESLGYEKQYADTIVDIRNVISSRNDYLHRSFYQPHAYQQVFGSKFVPNLSVIDLVCCMGPEAGTIIKLSQRKIEQIKQKLC